MGCEEREEASRRLNLFRLLFCLSDLWLISSLFFVRVNYLDRSRSASQGTSDHISRGAAYSNYHVVSSTIYRYSLKVQSGVLFLHNQLNNASSFNSIPKLAFATVLSCFCTKSSHPALLPNTSCLILVHQNASSMIPNVILNLT